MDESEKLVAQFLAYKGFQKIFYEPDGNIPPDFLVDGRIAVEVRRLNQNVTSKNGNFEGLEETAIPLWHKVNKLVLSMGLSLNQESWFVCIDFHRPVDSWKKLESKIRLALNIFRRNPSRSNCTLIISPSFQIDILRAGKVHDTFFLMGGSSDDDSGGWVLAEIEKNLKLCVAEKREKIKHVRSKYDEWWLVLPDHIGYGLDEIDKEQFRESISLEHDWDKVILLDPRNHTRWFEI